MTNRERLMKTLQGKPVDRPAVSFYELNGLDEKPDNPDPFNIYSHPSWKPLLDLTREKTDRIVLRGVESISCQVDPFKNISEEKSYIEDGSRYTTKNIRIGSRTLTARTRQDVDVNTIWTTEHLLKNTDDLKAYLQIPVQAPKSIVNIEPIIRAEVALGDSGIVMIDTADPLCLAALLFDMGEYTIIAMTEQALFHELLERFASVLLPQTEAIAKALPGRLWRIYGPEFASSPYLPPALFREYVCKYVTPMVEIIHNKYGGYARIHSHGRLFNILDDIASMGADAIDPIEPPPQGDVELKYVREKYGKDLVLFGNLEVSDIENMPTDKFSEKVKQALDEGTLGSGRGFVLMPSASPYGRFLSPLTLKNYEKIIELVESL